MRYIKKSEASASKLENWKQTEADPTTREINSDIIKKKENAYKESQKQAKKEDRLSADTVWNLLPSSSAKGNNDFSKAILRELLLEEQGYICAYCGSRIVNNSHVKLDHVTPKSLVIEGTFKYHNIVAACSGGDYLWHTIQKGETLESIAGKYATSTQTIKNLNPNLQIEVGTKIEIRIGSDDKILVVVRFKHCDTKKEDNEHPIKPTDSDCQTLFKYSNDGKILGLNEIAKTTIEILGLNDNPYIIEKRHNIYLRFKKVLTILSSSAIPKDEKRHILAKWKPNLSANELEEMIFVKEFFWNTLPN